MPESEGEAIRRDGPVHVSWDLAREGGDYSVRCACSYGPDGKVKIHAMERVQTITADDYGPKEFDLELQPDGTYAPRQRVRAES